LLPRVFAPGVSESSEAKGGNLKKRCAKLREHQSVNGKTGESERRDDSHDVRRKKARRAR
jgi:hypothetical protein